MAPLEIAFRAGIRTLGVLAPPLAAEIAYRRWRDLGRPEAVHERDAEVHARAARDTIEIGGERVVTYAWGSGPRVVLLVHGWRSRASRFGALIRALESPDRTIVSFDAAANGDSGGTRTTVLEYAETITRLSARHGGFDAIVAHSFGVLATFLAVREGVPTSRIVGISGMSDAHQLVDAFARMLGLSPRVTRGLRRRIERRTFGHVPDLWRRFVTELDPTDVRTSVLLVHDELDPVVDVSQAALIADAHTGPVRVMLTRGLGHARILRDRAVIEAIRAFVDGSPAPVDVDTRAGGAAARDDG